MLWLGPIQSLLGLRWTVNVRRAHPVVISKNNGIPYLAVLKVNSSGLVNLNAGQGCSPFPGVN